MERRLSIDMDTFCMCEQYSALNRPQSQTTEMKLCFKAYSCKAFITIFGPIFVLKDTFWKCH